MIKTSVTISNKLGLHARASAKLTKLAGSFPCEVWLARGERRVNAKSIMGVMMLAAGIGVEVEIETTASASRRRMDAIAGAHRTTSSAKANDGHFGTLRMTFAVHGSPVARGIAIGRAVLVVSSRIDVAHYFIKPEQVETEIDRVRVGRNAVAEEMQRLQASVALMGPNDAPHELAALLDVHQMLLQDEVLTDGVKHWIIERLYNAEWALTTQLEVIARQFDEMEDEYLRERKADLEQVVERMLRRMKGTAAVLAPTPPRRKRAADEDDSSDLTAGRRASTCRWC